jgi:hypothetical protein
VRTWAPRGQTPVIQFHINWKQLSVIAGVTQIRCLHRLHAGSVKQAQIMLYLTKLKSHLKRPLLIAGDSLGANRA